MKSIIFILIIFISLNANNLEWVNKQIKAIKPLRNGVNEKDVNLLSDTFIYFGSNATHTTVVSKKKRKYTKVSKKYKFNLQAIMNSSVLINSKWYKNGSSIYGYKIKIVNRTEVVLSKKSRKIVLSTKMKNKKLKLK